MSVNGELVKPEVKPTLKAKKSTKRRPILRRKAEILDDAYYTVAELTNRESPYYLTSPATLFRWFNEGRLVPARIGRKVLIQGAAIHALLQGKAGNKAA